MMTITELRRTRRRWKRTCRQTGRNCPMKEAADYGQILRIFGNVATPYRFRQNPYPPGRRYDAYEAAASQENSNVQH
jgi:hypothetical protein